jgi:hypothetical protein
LIGILTDPGIGGTFLTWSVYYLRGDNNYFLVQKNKKINLIDNPLTCNNAHKFIPNQPNIGADRGLEKLYNMTNQLVQPSNHNEIVYLHNFDTEADTNTGVTHLTTVADKIILVTGKSYPLYHFTYSLRSAQWITATQWTSDPDIVYNHKVQKYFADSKNVFWPQTLTDVWDQREFIALNFDPHDCASMEDSFDHNVNHYLLDTIELYNFEKHITDMFDYLGLKINPTRYKTWTEIYKNWQLLHQSRMLFVLYFNKIINYIINGYDLDLKRFNLDIMQEAAIQHVLIYKHNLNLKTWQLKKFTNTKQLYHLLESNIHDLSKSKIKNNKYFKQDN